MKDRILTGKRLIQLNSKTKTLKKFTLVELLVVIAIIAILMTLLLPSLQMAKKASHKAKCMGNEKQIGQGTYQYLEDYNQELPLFTESYITGAVNPKSWYNKDRIGQYVGITKDTDIRNTTVECPAAPGDKVFSQYVYLYVLPGLTTWTVYRKIKHHSQKVIVADGYFYGISSGTVEAEGAPYVKPAKWRLWSRHNRSGNYLFFDGHVEPIKSFGPYDTEMVNMFEPYN